MHVSSEIKTSYLILSYYLSIGVVRIIAIAVMILMQCSFNLNFCF